MHSKQRQQKPAQHTRDEQKAGRKDLEAHNSLASESASQQDQNGTRGDGGSDLGGVANRGRTLLDDNVVSRVVSSLLALSSGDRGLVLEGEFLRINATTIDKSEYID